MTKQVTRQEMIKAVEKALTYHSKYADNPVRGKNSYGHRGATYRASVAEQLLRRLNNGGKASTHEVVGYFGKGARWAD